MSKKKSRRNKRSDLVKQSPEPSVLPAHNTKKPSNKKHSRNENRSLFYILCLGLLAIPIGFFPSGAGQYDAAFYTTVFLALILTLGLFWAVYKRSIVLIYSPFFAVLGIWLAAKLLTTATSILPYHSFWGTYKEWSDGFVYALAVAVIAVITVTLRLSQSRISRLVGLLSFEAVVLSAITISQALSDGVFSKKVRPISPLGNSDYFISYILLFLPVLLILLIAFYKKRKWFNVILTSTGSVIMILALFVSLPTHLQTILLPVFENGKPDATSGALDTKSISTSNFTQDESNTERWSEWQYGIDFGMSRPLIGTGPSTTLEEFRAAVARKSISLHGWNDTNVMNRSHNDLIEQFSQEGVIGLAAYLALWAVFVGIVVKRWKYIDPEVRPCAIGLGVGLILWFGFNQVLFTTVFSGVIVMVWSALLLSMVESGREVTGRLPVVILLTMAAALVFTGCWVGVYYFEDSMVNGAIKASQQLPAQTSGEGPADIHIAYLNLAKQEGSAANVIPSEPYFNEQAALAYLYTATETQSADAQAEANESMSYADKMLRDDPNSTEALNVAGNIQYLLSPIGSRQSQAGLVKVNKAIQLAPNEIAMYSSVAANALGMNDYATARKYIALGLAAPNNTASSKKPLLELEAKLPAQ